MLRSAGLVSIEFLWIFSNSARVSAHPSPQCIPHSLLINSDSFTSSLFLEQGLNLAFSPNQFLLLVSYQLSNVFYFPAHRHLGHTILANPWSFTLHSTNQVTCPARFSLNRSSFSTAKLLQGLRTTRRLHPASRVLLHQLEPNCLNAREPGKAVRQGVG